MSFTFPFKRAAIGLAGCFIWTQAEGQITDSTSILDWRQGVFPKEKPDEIYQIKANGFYRFFATNQQMPTPFLLDPASGAETQRNTLFIGDDTQLPNFLVNVSGRPSRNVSWGFDVFAFQFLNGTINSAYGNQVQRPPVYDPRSTPRLGANMGLNLGLNLYGSYYTQHGTFNIRLGGIHWFSMSDLTLGSFRGYNRFLLYERAPWDPIGQDVGIRYRQMFETGAIFQDLRWGERAIQGAIIEGLSLPQDWSFAFLYGKTELNGGFQTVPNYNLGGKLRKALNGTDFIGFNTLNNVTWLDSLNAMPTGFNIATAEAKFSKNGYWIHAEIGAGRYNDPNEDFPWGEAINVKVNAPKTRFMIPLEVHYYRISPYVVNNNGIFWNTSLAQASLLNTVVSDVQSANVLTPFSSSVVAIGQMTNNRQGINFNSDFEINEKLKFSVGYGISSEIEALQNQITYSHFVNQLIRSRFWRWNFPANVGPYGRTNVIYRDAFEIVQLTDDSLGSPTSTKKFNQIEVHGKYRTKLANRNFFAFFLGRYNTVQRDFSVIPVFNEDAYLRQYNSELEMYYQIGKQLFINSYMGYERVLGNYQTTLDTETRRPLNQTGWGVGLGLDIGLGKNAGLYIRHRWFSFNDSSFQLDSYTPQQTPEGLRIPQETLVELKVFF